GRRAGGGARDAVGRAPMRAVPAAPVDARCDSPARAPGRARGDLGDRRGANRRPGARRPHVALPARRCLARRAVAPAARRAGHRIDSRRPGRRGPGRCTARRAGPGASVPTARCSWTSGRGRSAFAKGMSSSLDLSWRARVVLALSLVITAAVLPRLAAVRQLAGGTAVPLAAGVCALIALL